MSIIGAEDEDFENELVDQSSDDKCVCFDSIELLKRRPTHLLVFMQHVILQFDPAPLLCYLHADIVKNLNSRDTKKQFPDFYNNFMDKGAILRVSVPPNITAELDRYRPELLSDDTQRRFAADVQAFQASEVAKQLEDFRQKRMMGMTLSEEQVMDVENHYPTDRVPMDMKEKSVAENLLEKLYDSQLTFVPDEEKCQAIFSAVAGYMKHLEVKNRAGDSKKSKRGFPWIKKNHDPPKPKSNRGFHVPNWIGGSMEVKLKDNEVDKDVKGKEIKGGSARGSLTETPVPSIKKPESSPSVPNVESPGPLSSNPITTSNNTELTPNDGQPGNCLELPTPTDGPLPEMGAGVSVVEHSSAHDAHPEESDKDSLEGPNFLSDAPSQSPTSPSPQLEEIDPRLQELELDPPSWRQQAAPQVLKGLSSKETKRQEVINELFATEHAHVRMLSVLQSVFAKPLEKEELLTSIELDTIFPNLEEIIEMHFNLYENLKKLRINDNFIVKRISPTLLNRFDGTEGEWFQKLTSRFCSHQTWALDQIKQRQKKEPRFNSFIQDAESKPQCRRLQLKDIIPTEMQRLTKYPLLLENIAKNTVDPEEKEGVHQSAECCRKILNHVNEEVKTMGNMLALKEYQKKLDVSGLKARNELYTEYKNLDLTQRRMLFEGPLIWRVTKEKAVDVQCLLLDDLLVLAQKQEDKVVLKCQNKSNSAVQDGKPMSPIIKLDSAFLREVATDRKAFYVIFTWESGAQIYELVAQSVGEMKTWTDLIKSTVDDLKRSGVTLRLPIPVPGSSPLSPSTPTAPISLSENGGSKSISDQDKDSVTGDKPERPRDKLMEMLTERGLVHLLDPSSCEQEKVADSALDEVMSLKRLLIGSISLSEDSQPDEEHEEEQPEKPSQETDSSQPTDESESTDRGYMQVNTSPSRREDGAKKEDEDASISAPLVLSQERMDEVYRMLHSLQKKIQRLQAVEEERHKLNEVLSELSLEGGNFQ
ncbi:rho guanine nucleotide exchange factor 1b isoform X1 [Fundulus heteroclitus]|uniref:rho guanine nucleotide exchange factor 1b isoform X1 n=2 Tax=Fundulus heteroclitus TaxID=8078 RepID=UPI00165A8500|nr:rho guanine nucleotide exchange factor 1b isoform X1 [Fundulus heteroclitus]XP_035991076.1 rho guanine nucleotide exchange factor 1b isoform X1 [Fundulus heteroclitus]